MYKFFKDKIIYQINYCKYIGYKQYINSFLLEGGGFLIGLLFCIVTIIYILIK